MAKPASPVARRVLFGCWLVVLIALLGVPSLRQLAVEQSRSGSPLEESQISVMGLSEYQADQQPRSSPAIASLAPSLVGARSHLDAQEWARRFPDDTIAQVEAAYQRELDRQLHDPNPGPWSASTATRRAFDEGCARFPDTPWLHAARLRYTFGEFPQLGQTMIDKDNTTQGAPSTQMAPVPAADEIERSLAIARRGSELEPGNAFFDICAALLHIQAGQADMATRSLQSAARKQGFDEHLREETQARIQQKRAQGPQTFEREMAVSAAMLLPQYAVMREAARRFVAHARALEAGGKHAEALQIYGALMSMGRSMNQGETLITSLVGRAIQAIAIARGRRAPTSGLPSSEPARSNALRILRLQAFVTYATAHHRFDLARQAEEDARADAALRAAQSQVMGATFSGVPNELMEKTTALWRIGAALLLQIALGLVALAPLSTWRFRLARAHKPGAPWIDVASAVLPAIVAVGACAAMLWQVRASSLEQLWGSSPEGPVPPSISLAWAIALAPLPLVAMWCAAGSLWSRRRQARAERVERSPRHHPRDRSARSAATNVAQVGAVVLGLGWLMLSGLALAILLIPADANGGHTATLVRWLLPAEGAIVLALHLFLRRQAAQYAGPDASGLPNAHAHAHDVAARASNANALERARRALCWTTALAAVAWMALALSSLPLRAQAQADLDHYMKNGEMSAIRQSAGLPAE